MRSYGITAAIVALVAMVVFMEVAPRVSGVLATVACAMAPKINN